MKRKSTLLQHAVRSALALGVSTALVQSPSVYAQDDTDKNKELTPQRVTGSRVKRTQVEGPSPVTVISRQDLDISGDVSLADVLRDMSANSFGSIRERSGVSGGAVGTAYVSLRGLGSERTLVLVDGRRMAGSPAAGGAAQDLNLVPFAAIDRIEILKDGASAVYGSDAIGGVINIIMRRDYEGLQMSVTAGRPSGDGGDENSFTLTGGVTSGKGNITFSVDHAEREQIFDRDRDYTDTGVSAFGFPGSYDAYDPTSGDYVGTFADPRCPTNIGDSTDFPNSGLADFGGGEGLCTFNYAATSAHAAQFKRDSILVNANYDIGNNINLFSRFSATDSETFGRYAPAPMVGGPTFLPLMSADNPNNPTQGAPGGPYDLEIYYRNVPGGTRDSWVFYNSFNALIGAEGSLDIMGGADWETAVQFNRVRVDDISNGLAFFSKLQNAIDDGSFDIFGVNGPTDPDVAKSFGHTQIVHLETDFTGIDGTLNFDVAQLPAGPVGMAVGFEAARMTFSQEFDPASNAGDVGGTSGGDNITGVDRSQSAIFAEALIPIVETVEAQVALRRDNYSDFGNAVSPKLGVAWRPNDDLLVRASWGEGFRAPGFDQLYGAQAQSFDAAIDRLRCNESGDAAADPDTLPFGHPCKSTQYQNIRGGNPDLDAEESESWSVGAVWEPTDDLSVGITYYDVELDQEVDILPLQTVLDREAASGSDPLVQRGDNGAIEQVFLNFQNLSQTRTKGIDIDFRVQMDAGDAGEFTLESEFTKVLEYERAIAEGEAFRDVFGEIAGTFVPDFRGWIRGEWARGDFGASLTFNHIGDMSDGDVIDLDEWNTWDAQVYYDTPWKGRVTFGVRNLTDEEPPQDEDIGHPNFDSTIHDLFGRVPYLRYTQDL